MNILHLKSSDKKYKVSICAIFKNEAKFLKEWVVFNHVVGVEHFYLYNNNSTDNFKTVLKEFIETGLVTLIEWPMQQGQMPAYKDCVEKYSSETEWICFLDLDEMIVPIENDNVYDFLKKFNNRPIVIAYWKMFCSSGKISRDEKKLITEDFTVCWPKLVDIGKCFYNTKFGYGADLRENTAMHNRWGKYKNKKIPPVNCFDKVCIYGFNPVKNDKTPIQINHYFTKSYNEYLEKVSRGDAYFKENPRNDEYFYEHEMKCTSVDYSAYKYLIKVKREMGIQE